MNNKISALIFAALCLGAAATAPARAEGLFAALKADYAVHYSADGLAALGLVAGAGGLMAHTEADDSAYRPVSAVMSESWSERSEALGDAAQLRSALPVYVLSLGLGLGAAPESGRGRVATWGGRSLRALALGGPQFLFLGRIAGGGTPADGDGQWQPFEGDDGVSGHAFFGALPLLTAARMSQDPWLRYGLFTSSALPALARVDARRHDLSQVAMGWGLAYLATATVARDDPEPRLPFEIIPLPLPDGFGVRLRTRW